MTDYRIVTADATDYATIRKIAHATWPDTFRGILSGAQIDYMLRLMYSETALAEQAAKGHVFKLLVSALRGHRNTNPNPQYLRSTTTRFRPVGYVSYELDFLPQTTKIHKLYLLPETQGLGFGRALLRKVEQIARNAGQQRLRLDVNYQNKAIAFYKHQGWQKTEECTTDIGQGFLMEDWVMEKHLTEKTDI